MELLESVVAICSFLLLSITINFDTRRPMSTKLKYKYRVKDNSI